MLLALGKSKTEVKDGPLNSILNTKGSSSNLVIKMNKGIIDRSGTWEGEIVVLSTDRRVYLLVQTPKLHFLSEFFLGAGPSPNICMGVKGGFGV